MILSRMDGIMKLSPACEAAEKTMGIQDILQQLAVNAGTFPREAVEHAIAQREEITKNPAGCPIACCGEESGQPGGLVQSRHAIQS